MAFAQRQTPSDIAEMNITPLVDVMLVMLVIFMITTPLMLDKTKVNLPQVLRIPQGTDIRPTVLPVTVAITEEGRLFLNDEPVTDAVLKDIIDRLIAYRDAGADCLYAPGLVDPAHIAKVVAIGSPVNVLALAGGPTVAELTALGVRRISTGGSLAFAAYGAMMRAARELSGPGTATYQHTTLTAAERAAFD